MDSYNKGEIEKFDRLAKDFWDKDGGFKTLHQINPIRLDFIESMTRLDQNVADIGCGGGILSEALAKKGARVTAIDLSQEAIRIAKAHKEDNLMIDYMLTSSSELLKTHSEAFDVVCCMEMLEHVDSPEDIIADCALLLKEGGFAFFSTINKTLKAKLLAVYMAENILGMVPKGTHNADYFIKPSWMRKVAESNGLRAVDIIGFEYDLFQKGFVKSKNTDINYIFAFQKQAKIQ